MTRASAKADMLAQLPKLLGENQYLYIGNEVNTASESDSPEVIGVIFRLIFDSIVGTLAQIKISDDVTLEVSSSDTYFNAKYMNSLMAFKQIPVGFIWKQRVRDMISDILTANRLRDDRKTNLLYEYDIARSGAALRKAIYNIFNTVARLKDSIPGIVTITSTLMNVKVDNPAKRIYNDEMYVCRVSAINGYTKAGVSASVARTDGSLVTIAGKDADDYSGDQILIIPPSNPKAVSFNILASGSVSKLATIVPVYEGDARPWTFSLPPVPPYTGTEDVPINIVTMPGFKFDADNPPYIVVTRDGTTVETYAMVVSKDDPTTADTPVDIPPIFNPNSSVEIKIYVPAIFANDVDAGDIVSTAIKSITNSTTLPALTFNFTKELFFPLHIYVYYTREVSGSGTTNAIVEKLHYEVHNDKAILVNNDSRLKDNGMPAYGPSSVAFTMDAANKQVIVGGAGGYISGGLWGTTMFIQGYFPNNVQYAVLLSEDEIDYLP